MLSITDAVGLADALASSLDPPIKAILSLRRDQLLHDTEHEYELDELVQFIVVQPDDTVAQIEAAANYPVVTDPAFEVVEDHGGVWEAITILSSDGFGVVLIVPDHEGIDPLLISLLREQVQPAKPFES